MNDNGHSISVTTCEVDGKRLVAITFETNEHETVAYMDASEAVQLGDAIKDAASDVVRVEGN